MQPTPHHASDCEIPSKRAARTHELGPFAKPNTKRIAVTGHHTDCCHQLLTIGALGSDGDAATTGSSWLCGMGRLAEEFSLLYSKWGPSSATVDLVSLILSDNSL